MLEHVLGEHPDKKWSESLAFFSELNRGITFRRTPLLDASAHRTKTKDKIKGSAKKRKALATAKLRNKIKKPAVHGRRKYSKSRCQKCGDNLVNFYYSKKAGDSQFPSGGRVCQSCYSFLKREGNSWGYLRYSYASASQSVYTVGSGQTQKGYRY